MSVVNSAPQEKDKEAPSETASSGYSTPSKNELPWEGSSRELKLAERTTAYTGGRGPVTNALVHGLKLRSKAQRIGDDRALDDIATQPSVYDGPQAHHYQPRSDWEGIDAFDPSFRWTWREERMALRKVDWKVLTWVCVMFFALDIDRYNIQNATADNFLKDLNLTTSDYNLGNTLSKLGFLLAELPSQLISKRLGPDRWIPMQIVVFSIISGAQFWLKGRTSFLATRFVIAAFQGGFIPDVVLYLSYWYNKYDLPIRLAIFYTINPLSQIITAFLGAGLNQMRGVLGYAGWKWMFLIEGLFTLLIGIASFWMMPVAPAKTKTKFRPNGYITDREAKIIVNRALRDEPTKGNMHNRQPLTLRMIWKSCLDWHLWPVYLLGLIMWIPITPISYYLQLSFKGLGFSTIQANLLAVPYGVLAIINCVAIAVISELFDNRTFVCMAMFVWIVPCFIALEALRNIGPWQYFAIATVMLGYPYTHAIQVAWCSRNAGSIRTRTVAASLYNMTVQLSQIIGSNVYQPSDAPRYRKANAALLGISVFMLVLYPLTFVFYRTVNRLRDRKWDAMTDDDKNEYLKTTKDEGSRRLDFRFAY